MKAGMTGSLNVRAETKSLNTFKRKCRAIGKTHSDVIRDMIYAFNEGRLRIELTDKQKEIHRVD